MSKINCPDCGAKIELLEDECPYCGFDMLSYFNDMEAGATPQEAARKNGAGRGNYIESKQEYNEDEFLVRYEDDYNEYGADFDDHYSKHASNNPESQSEFYSDDDFEDEDYDELDDEYDDYSDYDDGYSGKSGRRRIKKPSYSKSGVSPRQEKRNRKAQKKGIGSWFTRLMIRLVILIILAFGLFIAFQKYNGVVKEKINTFLQNSSLTNSTENATEEGTTDSDTSSDDASGTSETDGSTDNSVDGSTDGSTDDSGSWDGGSGDEYYEEPAQDNGSAEENSWSDGSESYDGSVEDNSGADAGSEGEY